MVSVEIAEQSMKELWELRRRNQKALKELSLTGKTAVTRMLAFMVGKYADAWEAQAPILTGSLRASTTGKVHETSGMGQVFINQQTVNPILGGKPSVYGPVVHNRKPWVSQVFTTQTPRITRQGAEFVHKELDAIYKK